MTRPTRTTSARTAQGARWDRPVSALLLAALAAVGALAAASRPWVHAVVQDAVRGRVVVDVSGRQAVPLVPAVALVALAAGVALLLARTAGRRVSGLVLVVAGAGAAAASLGLLRAPRSGVAEVVARASGAAGTSSLDGAQLQVTLWPWLGVVTAVLTVAAGVLAVVRARAWGLPKARHESAAAATQPSGAGEPQGRARRAVAAGDGDAGEEGGGEGVGADPSLTWDALTRGEDPTRDG